MVLRAFWGSLGLLLGALGGLLGALLGLQIDPKGLPRSGPFALWVLLGSLFGLFFSILAAEDCLKSVLELPWAPFWWSRGLLGALLLPAEPILSSKRSTK